MIGLQKEHKNGNMYCNALIASGHLATYSELKFFTRRRVNVVFVWHCFAIHNSVRRGSYKCPVVQLPSSSNLVAKDRCRYLIEKFKNSRFFKYILVARLIKSSTPGSVKLAKVYRALSS